MSRTVNKITLVGNVGSDPDVRETKSGTKVAHLSLATNRPPFGEDGEEKTDWHRLTFWARLAQFAEDNVRKDDRIYVEGRVGYDTYQHPHRRRERQGARIARVEGERGGGGSGVAASGLRQRCPPPGGESVWFALGEALAFSRATPRNVVVPTG